MKPVNYLKEIPVPFSNIREDTESRLLGHPVTVHFKDKIEYGGKITFIPQFSFAVKHPLIS